VHAARARGVDVRAITAWALLGSYDWDSLVTRSNGHYEPGAFDLRAPVPRPTALATAIREIADGQEISHPVAASVGWWRRSGRLLWSRRAPDRSLGRQPDGPPLLIFGATGTLGRAFAHVCGRRGLAVHSVSHADVDATDSAGVDAILRRVRPWAVVNAAGYVRVDAAETDVEGCRRGNITVAATIAAACRRRTLPMVTFSSDLVFDGAKPTPYTERDPLGPLNVYGVTKAEMERRVRDILPESLIIRTSAFFGPWDNANFATQLWHALMQGSPFTAADDSMVSPTYVPHLVDAVLDLLIDGETGVWHLANDGAVTWWTFGRQLAEQGGLDSSLVIAAPGRDVWSPAVRPRFSVLTSERGQVMPSLQSAIDEYIAHMIETSADRERRSS
jgi:dTDP-4-dehydrorhamnose reductase